MKERLKYLVPIFVQLVLAVAAIWYSLETRSVRKQNDKMVNLEREQLRLSIVPDLLLGIMEFSVEVKPILIEEILTDETIDEQEKRRRLEMLEEADVKFVALTRNLTPTVAAHHVNAYVFDAEHRSFLVCDFGKEVVEGDTKEMFQISGPFMSLKEIQETMTFQYGSRCEFIFQQLQMEKDSYVLVVFKDLGGRIYAVTRMFRITQDRGAVHTKPGGIFFEE